MRLGRRGPGPKAVAGGWGPGRSVQPCLPRPLRAGDQRRAQKGCGFQEGPGGREGGVSCGQSGGPVAAVAPGPGLKPPKPPGCRHTHPGPGSAPSWLRPLLAAAPRPPAPSSLCVLQAVSRPLWTPEPLRPLPAAGPGLLTQGLDPRPRRPPGPAPLLGGCGRWGGRLEDCRVGLGCPPRAGTLMLLSPPHCVLAEGASRFPYVGKHKVGKYFHFFTFHYKKKVFYHGKIKKHMR